MIDRKILKEAEKMEYADSDEIDGTMDDYTSVILEFAFLSLFGVSLKSKHKIRLNTSWIENIRAYQNPRPFAFPLLLSFSFLKQF